MKLKPLFTIALAFFLVSCGDEGPFPQDWTARPISAKDAAAERESRWLPVIAKIAQNHGTDVAKQMEEQRKVSQSEWTAFLAQMKQGDELWFFSTPQERWESLSGREGYAIVRDGGQIIDRFFTRRN